jgi:hypothetical protein
MVCAGAASALSRWETTRGVAQRAFQLQSLGLDVSDDTVGPRGQQGDSATAAALSFTLLVHVQLVQIS